MIAFGHLPRTKILNGKPGGWTGQNNFFTGIYLYRTPDMTGVWAQEFWEWRLNAFWAAIALLSVTGGAAALYALHSWIPLWTGLLGFGLAMAIGLGNRAAREIYSHAITLEAALMVGEPCTIAAMVGSLQTYSYCRRFSADQLTGRLFVARPKARAWCQAHRKRIDQVAAIAAGGA